MKQNPTPFKSSNDALSPATLSPGERRAAVAVASIFALRMLGLFMVLPVFAAYAERYAGYTATLAGVAIGIYGLSQAALQIPFGMLSDRVGRKPVILAGLLLFAAGSVVAALAESIHGVILGRALQGGGAIAGAAMALTADLTREEQRTKAMAFIGVSIGLAFAVAFVSGPLIARWVGLAGVFWTTAALALAAVAVLTLYVPTPMASRRHRDAEPVPEQLGQVLKDRQLVRLDLGILCLHLILTATFVVMPLVLRDAAGLPADEHWKVYLAVLALSVALMAPFVVLADKDGRIKQVFAGAVLVLAVVQAAFMRFHADLLSIVALMVVFFAAFNVLEATLPSLVTRVARPGAKGTALGVYSTSQFLGAFLGGVAGGWLHGRLGPAAVFALCALLAAGWFAIAATMPKPRSLASRLVRVGSVTEHQAREMVEHLRAIHGVTEAVIVPEEGVAYLKVDPARLDEETLRAFSTDKA